MCRCVILDATAVQEGSRRLAQIGIDRNAGGAHEEPTVATEDSITDSIVSDMNRIKAKVGGYSAQIVISRSFVCVFAI